MGFLFSLIWDSEILKKSKLSLFSVRIVENFSKLWVTEDIFIWKTENLEIYLFMREDISLGSKHLVTARSLFVSSMIKFALSIRLYPLG